MTIEKYILTLFTNVRDHDIDTVYFPGALLPQENRNDVGMMS